MSVLVLQHEAVEGPGRIAAALQSHSLDFDIVRLDLGAQVPKFDSDSSGLVVLGGSMGLADIERLPHLDQERTLIARYLDSNIPVLGVCLGAQLMASALGAKVVTGGAWELGWHAIELTDAARQDPLFAGCPKSFAALHWHRDQFELPAGVTKLAISSVTPVQAFSAGSGAYGLLFHLEADLDQIAKMAQSFPGDLVAAGVSAAELNDEISDSQTRTYARQVFSRWVQLVKAG